ncbi:hypothetical protein HMPREF0083_02560 [Aneurinibacillus aneurinilyticus ATCC 12856]|uniref:Uncharacterized protein n=1 Tax=Aneurinibacillus aneurinilyticus ATCC 12856 TaxID=649747 RepID=U1YEU7_ANEAE|nr:hypothetical protein HMPREF0083_02560 [Aneurinibacillus aneurinilyticus ATCC 12856]
MNSSFPAFTKGYYYDSILKEVKKTRMHPSVLAHSFSLTEDIQFNKAITIKTP